MAAGKPRNYTEEFKRTALERLKTTPRVVLAKELNLSLSTLTLWKKESGEAMVLRKHYTEEFKSAAAARVRAGETGAQVGKDLGVHPSVVRAWAKGVKIIASKGKARPPKKHAKGEKYDSAFRARVMAELGKGELRPGDVAKKFSIHPSVIYYWTSGHKKKKEKYAAKVAKANGAEHAAPGGNGRSVHSAISLLRGVRSRVDVNDPVHLTAMLALSTLEGKM